MATTIGSLEETALKRKERLRNLRNKAPQSDKNDNGDNKDEEKVKLPKPMFRSYKPLDERLQDSAMPKAKPTDEDHGKSDQHHGKIMEISWNFVEEVTDRIQTQMEATKSENNIEEVDLMNLAPRKPDWDLKRDVAKKLEKLEKRTQRAIAELIRERLKTGNQDLAQVVNAGTMRTQQTVNVDDDDDDDDD